MRYKCVIKDQYDTWFTVGKEYDGESMIPPLIPNEGWLIIYNADDNRKAYARANQFMQIIERKEGLEV